jgi:HPt (histidine-containing phosphotransfer) domain-containing protein
MTAQQTKPLVDVNFGLSQLGNNNHLLNKMLIKFKHEFEWVPETVRQQIETGDYAQAKMHVHTAKGITGNLGLLALYEYCKSLETQLKQQALTSNALKEFADLMRATCSAIDAHNADFALRGTARPVNHISDAKTQLLALLSTHQFINDKLMHDLLGSLDFSEDQKTTMVALIEQLQYDKAIAMLNL